MEQLPISTSADLIDRRRVQVNEDGAWDSLAAACLIEEGLEGILAVVDGGFRVWLAIRSKAMLREIPGLSVSLHN